MQGAGHIFEYGGHMILPSLSHLIPGGGVVRPPLILPGVTIDGPSLVYVPQNAADWVTLGLPAPIGQWNCQDASADLVAAVGGIPLVAAGAGHLYQQVVAGWSRAFVGTTEVVGLRWNSVNALFDLAAGQSAAMLGYASVGTPASGGRRLLTAAGAANGVRSAVSVMQTAHNNVATSSVNNYNDLAVVHPWLWFRNATTNVSGTITDLETFLGTHDETAFAGQGIGIGVTGVVTALCLVGLIAFWSGADAETIAQASTLTTLGW